MDAKLDFTVRLQSLYAKDARGRLYLLSDYFYDFLLFFLPPSYTSNFACSPRSRTRTVFTILQ